ncbi:MAG: NUDIX domain-containing protein [archaeon]
MSHVNEKIDYTVEVFVVRDKKVLLRLHDKYKIWLSVGGHVKQGEEDFNEAARREVQEETGLEVELAKPDGFTEFSSERFSELVPPVFLNRHRINEKHEHVAMTFFAVPKKGAKAEDLENSGGLEWVSLSELENPKYNLSEHVKFYAKKAIAKTG